MLTVRRARSEEWSAIAEITVAANQEYSEAMGPEHWQRYEKSTREFILSEPALLRILAMDGEEIVGSVVYCPPYEKEFAGQQIKNPYPEMRLLSIVPQHRNKGIAAKLIDACEKQASLENSSAITLHTTRLMAIAKSMYERRGYVRFSDIDFQLAPEVPVLGYIKQLRT